VWHIPSLGKVVSHIQEFIKTHPQDTAKSAVAGMPQELLQSFDTCFLLPLPSFTDENSWQEELQKTTKELQTLCIREKMKKISEEMSAKEKTALPEEIAVLQEEFARLAVQLKK
jgi:hypothetical protein